MKITRRITEHLFPDGTQVRDETETAETGFWDAFFGSRRPKERVVLNGDWWALETRDLYGVGYTMLHPATRAELLELAHMNVNPNTAGAIRRGEVRPPLTRGGTRPGLVRGELSA